ncbi:hypothetical protein MASR1M32_17610 [Rhodobacter sp.]
MPGLRRHTHRLFGQAQPAGTDVFGQRRVFFGIDHIDAAGLHRDGARRQRRLMRGLVDAAGRAETTAKPACPNPSASRIAIRNPSDEALRAPTMATIGRASRARSPCAQSTGGASFNCAKAEG